MEEAPKNGRRQWLIGALATVSGGAGVAALTHDDLRSVGNEPGGTQAAPPPAPVAVRTDLDVEPEEEEESILAPFGVGAAIGRWRIRNVAPVINGSVSIIMTDPTGTDFQLDVYARDFAPSALRPPGRSARFDVYLSNGGRGKRASFEEHGLAAMAVAEVLRQNEGRLDASRFVTLRERLETSRDTIRRSV